METTNQEIQKKTSVYFEKKNERSFVNEVSSKIKPDSKMKNTNKKKTPENRWLA